MKVDDVLRYGIILTDDDFCDDMASNIRVKVMSCQDSIYYIKMVNGEVEEFKKVGVAG